MSHSETDALRRFGRRQFMQLCASSLAVAAAGCRRTDDPAYRRGSTLIMAVSDVSAVLPDATDLDWLPFMPLATNSDNGDYVPRLAQTWEHSSDYREWTYHLRPGVRWHDGRAVTAHDVKFTLDLLGDPDVHEYFFDSVTVVDESTVRIRGRPGYQDDIVYYPKHLLERLDPKQFWEWDFWMHPVGSGPYRFIRYVPQTMMEFEANPDYYRGKRSIERVVLKFAGNAGFTELLSGNVDIVLQADPTRISQVVKDSRFRIYHSVSHGAHAIFWKCDHAFFRDAQVRRALTLAIDRQELSRLLYLPSDLPTTDGVITVRQLRRRQIARPLPYDPAQARGLLAAAGWRDQDRNGIRKQAGRSFRFTAITRNTDGMDRLAVYVQAMLRQVGVQMDVQTLDTGSVWARFLAGDFEAAFHFHQPGPDALKRDFGKGNQIGYHNSNAFRLTDELMETANPDRQDGIYRALTEIFLVEMPFTRLLPGTFTYFVHRRVRGLSTPFHAAPDTYIEDLWLEDRSGS